MNSYGFVGLNTKITVKLQRILVARLRLKLSILLVSRVNYAKTVEDSETVWNSGLC